MQGNMHNGYNCDHESSHRNKRKDKPKIASKVGLKKRHYTRVTFLKIKLPIIRDLSSGALHCFSWIFGNFDLFLQQNF